MQSVGFDVSSGIGFYGVAPEQRAHRALDVFLWYLVLNQLNLDK